MAELTINVFAPDSVAQAAREIRERQARFEQKQAVFLERLGQAGVQVAQARFDAALAEYDGEQTPIEVRLDRQGNTAEIVASGRTVAFLEFGTGVSHPEHSTGMFRHGTYGYGLGRLRSWHYPGRDGKEHTTTGNDPAEAMTGAVQEMAERVAETAREVFGGD